MTSVHQQVTRTTRSYQTSSDDYGSHDGKRSTREESWEERRKLDLPVTRGGRFFEDSSFDHARDKFDAAVRDILRRWGDRRIGDRLSARWDDTDAHSRREMARYDLERYRKLRERDLKEDNQAVTTSTDERGQKIVLDVYDFLNGDVRVDVSRGGCDVVVEGVARRQEGSKLTTISFTRRFPLDPDADTDSITANMTSDGILLITVPRSRRRQRLPELGKRSRDEEAYVPTERLLSRMDLGKELLPSTHAKDKIEVGRAFNEFPAASDFRKSMIELEGMFGKDNLQSKLDQRRVFEEADSLLNRSYRTRRDLEKEFEDDEYLPRPSRFMRTRLELDRALDEEEALHSDHHKPGKDHRRAFDTGTKKHESGELARWWKDYQKRMRTTPRESEMSRVSTSSSGRIRPSFRDWLY